MTAIPLLFERINQTIRAPQMSGPSLWVHMVGHLSVAGDLFTLYLRSFIIYIIAFSP